MMDKRARAGYLMTLDEAMKFWERKAEAEKALGQPLTREESEKLLQSMRLGEELTIEELLDYMTDKRTLIVRDKSDESL